MTESASSAQKFDDGKTQLCAHNLPCILTALVILPPVQHTTRSLNDTFSKCHKISKTMNGSGGVVFIFGQTQNASVDEIKMCIVAFVRVNEYMILWIGDKQTTRTPCVTSFIGEEINSGSLKVAGSGDTTGKTKARKAAPRHFVTLKGNGMGRDGMGGR